MHNGENSSNVRTMLEEGHVEEVMQELKGKEIH